MNGINIRYIYSYEFVSVLVYEQLRKYIHSTEPAIINYWCECKCTIGTYGIGGTIRTFDGDNKNNLGSNLPR